MPIATSDYAAAIAHLPAAAVLRLDNVPWEEYEQLLAELGPGYAVRIFYDRGRMEIMRPSAAHEKPKGIVGTPGMIAGLFRRGNGTDVINATDKSSASHPSQAGTQEAQP